METNSSAILLRLRYCNAIAERINGILKDEFGLAQRLNDYKQAVRLTKQGVNTYNTLRPHLSCDMLTPNQMHRQQQVKIKTYKKSSSILKNA